jgi:hypothetical protein
MWRRGSAKKDGSLRGVERNEEEEEEEERGREDFRFFPISNLSQNERIWLAARFKESSKCLFFFGPRFSIPEETRRG